MLLRKHYSGGAAVHGVRAHGVRGPARVPHQPQPQVRLQHRLGHGHEGAHTGRDGLHLHSDRRRYVPKINRYNSSLHLYHGQVWSTSPRTTTSTATWRPGTPWSGTTSPSRSRTSGCRAISTAQTTTASRASPCCQSGNIFHAQYNCKINSKYFYFCFKYFSVSAFRIFLFLLLYIFIPAS